MLKGIVITNKGHRVEDRSKSSQSKNVGGQSFVGQHITVLIKFLLLFRIICNLISPVVMKKRNSRNGFVGS